MAKKDWQDAKLPALVLSQDDLRKVMDLLGPETRLEIPGQGILMAEELSQGEQATISEVKFLSNNIELVLAPESNRSAISFLDTEETLNRAEQVLEELESHRRPFASFTHSDGAIFVGMLAPLLAGWLAPAENANLACGAAAGLWMLVLLWALHNARRNWCQFR